MGGLDQCFYYLWWIHSSVEHRKTGQGHRARAASLSPAVSQSPVRLRNEGQVCTAALLGKVGLDLLAVWSAWDGAGCICSTQCSPHWEWCACCTTSDLSSLVQSKKFVGTRKQRFMQHNQDPQLFSSQFSYGTKELQWHMKWKFSTSFSQAVSHGVACGSLGIHKMPPNAAWNNCKWVKPQ